jgi:CubicO group peptidase (beta-lactamase class C family)
LARVDNFIARQMQMRRIPGLSLGVVKDGILLVEKGYGNATVEWDAPARPETVYLLASMTKPFTSTAIMMLAGAGRLSVDDPVSKYIAGTPASWSGITIRHLLTHTSGLKDRFELTPDGRMFLDYSAAQMLDAAMDTATDAAPGVKWQYSDQGYFLLGIVIEKSSGLSDAQFLRDRIFTPAGMTSTSLHDWAAIVPNRADGYALAGPTLGGSRRRYQFNVVSHFGVQSTIRDLARFDAALSAGTLVSLEAQQQMWTPAPLGDTSGAGSAGIGSLLHRARRRRALRPADCGHGCRREGRSRSEPHHAAAARRRGFRRRHAATLALHAGGASGHPRGPLAAGRPRTARSHTVISTRCGRHTGVASLGLSRQVLARHRALAVRA